MKSGKLNFLEPSGPLQACNGTALPLPLLDMLLKYAIKVHYWYRSTKPLHHVRSRVTEMNMSPNPINGLLYRPAGRDETFVRVICALFFSYFGR